MLASIFVEFPDSPASFDNPKNTIFSQSSMEACIAHAVRSRSVQPPSRDAPGQQACVSGG